MPHQPKTIVTQEHDEIHDQVYVEKPPPHVYTNKNLMFTPLAQHRLTTTEEWKPSRKTGRLLCDLTDDIQLRMPKGTRKEIQFAPSAFDINIRSQCVMLARMKGNRTFETSASKLLKAAELAVNGPNLRRLWDETLPLLSALSIHYRRWHVSGRKKKEPHTVPPALQYERLRRLRITVDEEWLLNDYTIPVPLPLPNDATAQNLCLYLLPQWEPVVTLEIPFLCAKLRLSSHGSNRKRLHRAVKEAKQYYVQHAGALNTSISKHKIQFRIAQPPMVRDGAVILEIGRNRQQVNAMLACEQ